ncbi:MAG: translation initiation factor IF-2 subunit alpha [Candidatus Bathyarchaeota archaeon]|nr:translation initiation factor IF-2 subunit alpha [Candidatus Bathyarchaeota archaeon]
MNGEWPEVGEVTIGTVKNVYDYGAYIALDEYGGRIGFLHVSEVSTTWVRSIRDYVEEGRKVVVKIIRVDPEKAHIDLSLRRVTESERRKTLKIWKRKRSGSMLLARACRDTGLSYEEVVLRYGDAIKGEFEDFYGLFEAVVEKGVEALSRLGLPEDLVKAIERIAKEKISVKKVEVSGICEVYFYESDGVEKLKKAFDYAFKLKKPEGIEDIRAYTIGAPRYRIEIVGSDYSLAARFLKRVVDRLRSAVEKFGGNFKYIEER